MLKLNIANYISCTEVEGPGKRFVLWVQGCVKRCKECCNPEMQPLVANKIIEVDSVIEQIQFSRENKNIEGVTFLGGEPFLQAKGLSEIAKFCQQNKMSVLIFSGYTLSELNQSNFDGSKLLLDSCDILIDGEFDMNLIDNKRNWIGSKNQKVYYFSDFYDKNIEFNIKYSDAVEFRIKFDEVSINGDPSILNENIVK